MTTPAIDRTLFIHASLKLKKSITNKVVFQLLKILFPYQAEDQLCRVEELLALLWQLYSLLLLSLALFCKYYIVS